MRTVAAWLLCSCSTFGCVVPDVEITGKPCPCPSGYECVSQSCALATSIGGAAAGGAGAGAGPSGGGGPCQGVCGTPGCGDCPASPMVDAGGVFIDAYEATNADYAAFLADAVDPALQPSVCAWNQSFQPVEDGDESTSCNVAYDFSPPEKPISCIDWCDAAGFCAWAGKRMCGRVGGGTVPESEADDPEKSEWFAACSANDTVALPYGNTWDPDACNTVGNGGNVLGVGLFPDCNGGYDGIFDMVGNAEEWENACELSAEPDADNCLLRGGAFWADNSTPDGDYATCAFSPDRRPDRSAYSHDWGFRCCSDRWSAEAP